MLAAGALVLLAVSAAPASAQSAAQPAGLEEVVVTARKRAENLQDVPISITALDQAQIERLNLTNLNDLSKHIAGFTWSEGFSPLDARPAIRGQSNIRGASEPTVGVFIDGGNVPWRSGLNLQTVDIERIEVVKGPQSALFGRGVLSGAINYVTRRPERELGGYAEATVGEAGRLDLRARLDLPATDTLSFAATARKYEFDGFYTNTLTGRDGVGAEDGEGGSLAVEFRPSEDFTAYARVSYESEFQAQSQWHQVPSNTQTGALATQRWFIGQVPVDPDLIAHNCDDCAGFTRDVTWASLNLDWQLGGGTLSSITTYNQTDLVQDFDTDFTGLSEANLPVNPVFRNNLRSIISRDIQSIGQELRFASDAQQRFRWLVGGYYYDEDVDQLVRNILGTLQPPSAFPAVPQTDAISSRSLFGSIGFDVTDRLTAGVEVRWNQDDAEIDFLFANLPRRLENTWEAWLPRFTLDFKWTPDTLLYASGAKGSKPGGFNTQLGAGNVQLPEDLLAFDEESAWSYELGVKTRLLDRRMTLNVALFKIDWSDIQVDAQFVPPPPAVTTVGYTANAGKAEIEGAEIDLRFQATERLEFAAGYTYSPARVFDLQDNRTRAAGIITTPGEGQLPYSSDHTANATVAYTAPIANDWSGFSQLGAQYRSTQYATNANLAETGDRTLVDLRLGLRSERWELTGAVTNLFDDDTADNVTPFLNPQTFARAFIVAVPDPRQWSVRLRYTF